MELNINANVTFQRNKLLSLSGMYNGEMISAPEYKSLASLDGAGFHGGYNHIVYQMVGQPLGVFICLIAPDWCPTGTVDTPMVLRT